MMKSHSRCRVSGVVAGAVVLTLSLLSAGCVSDELFPEDAGSDEVTSDSVQTEVEETDGEGTDMPDAAVTEPGSASTDVSTDEEMPPEPDAGSDEVGTDTETDASTPLPQVAEDSGTPPMLGAVVELVGTEPVHQATDVEPGADVTLHFDRPVVAGAGEISILDTLNTALAEAVDVTDETLVTFAGSSVIIDWATTLGTSTGYSVVVEPGAIVAEDGSEFVGLSVAGEYAFVTRAAEPVTLDVTNPSTGDIDVELDTDISLVFSEDVVPGGEGAISIVDATTSEIVQTVLIGDFTAVDVTGPLVSVDLPRDLAYATEYYVVVDANAVVSEQGAPFMGFSDPGTLSFTTVAAPEVTLTTTTPADGAVDVDPTTPLVFTFNEDVVSGEGSIRVSPASGGADVVVDVADPAVEFTEDTVVVRLPVSLAEGEQYSVSIEAGAIVSTVGGIYAGLAASELSFTTALTPPDPLLLTSTQPAAGATDVPVDSDIVLEFNQDVRLGAGNISVYAEGVMEPLEVVAASSAQVTLSGPTATIDLERALNGGSLHYVLVSAGSFESLDGASFAGISEVDTFSFTTEETFRITTLAPADGATDVEPGVDLVLTFSEDIELGDGNIEVYRASGDVLLERVPLSDAERVQVSGPSLAIDLDHLMASDTEYYVRVDGGAISSVASGIVFEGIATTTGWNFRTAAVAFPGDVSAGLVLWLDAAYEPSLESASGVRRWADRSGLNNDVAQAVAGERPAFVASAIGDLGAVRFDGNDDWLVADDGFDFTAFDGFVVWQSSLAPNGGQRRSLIVNGDNLELNHDHWVEGARNAVSSCVGSSCTWFDSRFRPSPSVDKPTLWSFGFDAVTTSVISSVDGGIPVFNTGPNALPTPAGEPLSVGGNRDRCTTDDGCHFTGDIAEIVLYSRRLSQAERLAVVASLRSKWSLDQPRCGADETRGANGYCYYYGTNVLNWSQARDACVARGAGWHLATARTQLDHEQATARISGTDVWIGASDSEVPETWRWLNDTLNFWNGLSAAEGGVVANGAFAKWRSDEPSGGSAESCGRYNLDADEGWTWADSKCDSTIPYLCEGPGD